jgi:probable F420-dependent oxidoreductase
MKFGYPLFGVRPHEYAAVAQRAEAAGFESIWMPEHMVFPLAMPATYPYSETGMPPVYPGSPMYDAWVVLGFIAASTKTIRLGTNVYILPLRHPLVTAKAFTTLDVLSGGRAILGAGVGWLEDEYRFAGQSFRNRGKRGDEIIGLLRTLWTEKVIDHHGEYYDLGPLRCEPKPIQSPPPIEIGGISPPAIRRAARLGDGWLAMGQIELGDLAQRIKHLHTQRAEAGRSDQPFEVSFTNRLELTTQSVERYAEIGVTRLMLEPPWPDGSKFSAQYMIEFIDRCSDEVISKTKSSPHHPASP